MTTVVFLTAAPAPPLKPSASSHTSTVSTPALASTTPDFTIVASPDILTIASGTTKPSTITLTSEGGFTGPVYLASHDGSFATASLSSSLVPLTTTATSTLTITAPSDAPPFDDIVSVDAVGGCSLFHLALITVHVGAPDFAISASKAQMTITPGGSGTSNIAVTSRNGFMGTVTLSALSQLPAVLTATSITLTAGQTLTSTLTVLVPVDTEPGNYSTTVLAESGNLFPQSADITVTVAGPAFALTASHYFLELIPGGASNSSTITVTASGGFANLVDFALHSSPSGLTTLLDPFSLSVPTASASTLTVSASAYTRPGLYSVYITGTSGPLTSSVSIIVFVKGPQPPPPPDFEVFPIPPFLFLLPGSPPSTCTSTLMGIGLSGFTGTIALAIVTSHGLTAQLSAPSLTIPGTPKSTLTVSAPADTKPGSYDVEINATSSSLARFHLVDLTVEVVGPFFSLSSNPTSLSIAKGGQGTSIIGLSGDNGFAQQVALTVKSLNTNFTAILDKSSVSGSQTAMVIVTVNPLATHGSYFDAIIVNGTSGTTKVSIDITITVKGDFSVTATPTLVTVGEGTDKTSAVSIAAIDGFTGTVSLFASASSSNLNATIQPSLVLGSGPAVLHVNSTIPGVYEVDIFADSRLLSHEASVAVIITGPDFTLSASPPSLTITAGSFLTSSVSVSTPNGFTGQVALGTTQPQGITANLSPNIITPGQSSVLTITVDPTMTPGSYVVEVLGSNGSLIHPLRMTVNVAGFIVRASPDTLTISQGTSQSTTVQAASLNGFAGTKTLSTVASTGLTPNPSPTTVTTVSGSFQLNIAAGNNLAPGSYTANVTGTSGLLSQNTTITIKVSPPRPDFTISVGPVSPASINVGSFGTATATVYSLNGISGVVSLLVNAPGGLACSPLNTVNVPPDATPTLSCTSSTASDYSVSVMGNGGGLTRISNSVTFHFVAPSGFTLSANPSSITTVAGTAGASVITVTPIGSFSGMVTLVATGAPAACTVTLPTPVTLPPAQMSTLSVTCPSAASFTIMVTATSGSTSATPLNIPVTIEDFSLTASPSSITTTANIVGTSQITVNPIYGFTGTVTLVITSAPPTGCTQSLSAANLLSVTCATGAAPFDVVVQGASGSLKRTVNVPVTVQDFALSAPAITTTANTAGTSQVTVNAINGFTGTVTFSIISTPPAGCTNTVSTAGLLSLTCSTVPAPFTVTVRGVSGSTTRAIDVSVTVQDFTLSASAITTSPNTPGTSQITLNRINGFTGTVTLVITSAPPTGCTQSLSVTNLLSVTCSSTNSLTVVVQGTSGSLQRTVNVPVTVTNLPDFTVSIGTVSAASIDAGSSGTATVTVHGVNGFNYPVTLTANAPPGLSCNALSLVYPSPDATATLSCSSTTAADYLVTVTGVGYGLTRISNSVTFHFVDFSISASPTSVGPFSAGDQDHTVKITVTYLNGFSGTVQLTTNPSSGLTATASPTGLAASGTSTLTVSAPTAGTYTVTITGKSLPLSHTTTTITVRVVVADITLASSSTSLSFNTGSSATATISVTPTNGFSGTVTLTVSAPSGVTCTINPSTVQPSGIYAATSTLTCTSSTAGDYTVTVTASGGATPHQATFTVHVTTVTPAAPAPTILGLDPTVFYAIVGAVIAIIVIAGVTIFLRQRKP